MGNGGEVKRNEEKKNSLCECLLLPQQTWEWVGGGGGMIGFISICRHPLTAFYLIYFTFFFCTCTLLPRERVCLSTSARYNCLIVSNATASFPRQRFAKSLISSYWTARILEGLYWLSCLCLCSTHTLMKSQVCGTFWRPHTNTHGMFRPCTLLSDHICPISHVHFSHSLTLPS